MTKIYNPMRAVVAVLICAAMIPGVHQSAYAMRVVNAGAMGKPVVRALANVYGFSTPKWQTAFSNFLNSPTFDAGILPRVLEGTSEKVSIIKLRAAAVEANRMEGLVAEGAGEFFARFQNPSEAQLIDAGARLAAINAFVARNLSKEQQSALGLTEAIATIREQLPEENRGVFDEAQRIAIDESMRRTVEALGRSLSDGLTKEKSAVLSRGPTRRKEMPASWRLGRVSHFGSIDGFLETLNVLNGELSHSQESKIRRQVMETFLMREDIAWLQDPAGKKQIESEISKILEDSVGLALFVENMQSLGLLDLYTTLPGPGRYFDVVNVARNAISISKRDVAFALEVFEKAGFGFVAKAIKPFSPNVDAFLYSGFPRADAIAIHAEGYRDGIGYGSPGSVQLNRGIFTTEGMKEAQGWGEIKAQKKNNEELLELRGVDLKAANVFEFKIKIQARLLDIQADSGNVLHAVNFMNQDSSYRQYLKNSKFMREMTGDSRKKFDLYRNLRTRFSALPDWIWKDPVEAMSTILNIDIVRAKIFIMDGIGGGIEHIIRNRSVIARSRVLENGSPIDLGDSARAIANAVERESQKTFLALIAQGSYLEAARFADAVVRTYRGISAFSFRALLAKVDAPRKNAFLAELVESDSDREMKIFLEPELLSDDLLRRPDYVKALKQRFDLGLREIFSNTENRDETLRSRRTLEWLFLEYLRTHLSMADGAKGPSDAQIREADSLLLDPSRKFAGQVLDTIMELAPGSRSSWLERLDIEGYLHTFADYDAARVFNTLKNGRKFTAAILRLHAAGRLTLPKSIRNAIKRDFQDIDAVAEDPLGESLIAERVFRAAEAADFVPEELIAELKRDPFLRVQFSKGVGVWEGLTLERHTLMVLRQFDKHFADMALPMPVSRGFMRLFLALHDIGKPRSIETPQDQHESTLMIVERIAKRLGLPEEQTRVAVALAMDDPVGRYMQRAPLKWAVKRIQEMAKKARMPAGRFFNLLRAYYLSDASSYTRDAGAKGGLDHLFLEGKNAESLVLAHGPSSRFETLAERFTKR